jgi:hypothetical protein
VRCIAGHRRTESDDEDDKRKNANGDSGAQHLQYFQFGTRQAALLTSVLTHTQLPGLSSVDQMHLLAPADTLSSCSATHLVTSTIHSEASKNLRLFKKLGTSFETNFSESFIHISIIII